MRFAVFCYDFPHWKTQTGLMALLANWHMPTTVFAAPWVNLDIKRSKKRINLLGNYLVKEGAICTRFGIPYYSVSHCSEDCLTMIQREGFDLGIILGARILSKEIIDSFPMGIINIHPGILPENRGLDNVKWAIRKNLPMGVTAHLIDEKIDAGQIIDEKSVRIYPDDSMRDVQFRIQNEEIRLLIDVINKIARKQVDFHNLKKVDTSVKPFRCMEDDSTIEMEFEQYKRARV